jgi:hypothetical protein
MEQIADVDQDGCDLFAQQHFDMARNFLANAQNCLAMAKCDQTRALASVRMHVRNVGGVPR